MQKIDLVLSSPGPECAGPARRCAGAVIIGGNYRALGVARSLGRHGIPSCVLTDQHSIAAISRYTRRALPWPQGNEQDQLHFLLSLGEQELNGWTLIPTGDDAVSLIARYHAQLRELYRLTTPPWSIVSWAHDKRLTYRLAAETGVAYPQTYYPADRAQVAALDCSFPVILKPAIKEGFNPFVHAKAWRVDDRASLLARYDEACALVSPEIVMVQELIPGGGEAQLSFAALCQNGKPIAWLTARRSRQYPSDFGRSSTYVETVDCPVVEQPARVLLAALDYSGLVEIEFKYDQRDGRYKLLDINPRVWGWHTLGQHAGVDFPYLLWRLHEGEPLAEQRGRPGVGWVRMLTDVPATVHDIWHGRLSPLAYLRSLQRSHEFAILAKDDPLPALLDLPLLFALALRRGAA